MKLFTGLLNNPINVFGVFWISGYSLRSNTYIVWCGYGIKLSIIYYLILRGSYMPKVTYFEEHGYLGYLVVKSVLVVYKLFLLVFTSYFNKKPMLHS